MHFFYRVLFFLALSVVLKVVVLTYGQDDYVPIRTCEQCIADRKKWGIYKKYDLLFRECVPKVREDFWTGADIKLLESCTGVVGDDQYAFELEILPNWPSTCKECLENPKFSGLRWLIQQKPDGWFRACFPEELKEVLALDPNKTKLYKSCKPVRPQYQTKKYLKYRPVEWETCDKCVKNGKSPWCVVQADKTKTSFCTSPGRGGKPPQCEGGKASTNCTKFPDDAKKKFETLAKTCDECLAPGKEDVIWCIISIHGRKIKHCVLKENEHVLCPNPDARYEDCLSLSSTDKIASEEPPTEDEDETQMMLDEIKTGKPGEEKGGDDDLLFFITQENLKSKEKEKETKTNLSGMVGLSIFVFIADLGTLLII